MPSLEIEPHILWSNDAFYVLNKPHAWPTTGHHLEDDDCIQYHLMRHHGSMVWALHQLDADTSGLCFFTTRKELVQPIKTLWSHAETHKDYLAIVHGCPDWTQQVIDVPIGRNHLNQLGVHETGKPAQTEFEVIDSNHDYSLLRARLFTGRTHQIRIHLQQLGHPLIGEEWYRSPPCALHPRQALHAYQFNFPENQLLTSKTYTAPLAADLQALATRLNLTVNPGYTIEPHCSKNPFASFGFKANASPQESHLPHSQLSHPPRDTH